MIKKAKSKKLAEMLVLYNFVHQEFYVKSPGIELEDPG
jgi:hypothetical protein